VFDPLAGAKRDANGTLVYEVMDKEFNRHLDEKRIRDQFERYSNQEAIDGSLEEDDDELRVILMEEMQANDMPVE